MKFIADYPKSEFRTRAEESLTGARAAMADESLTAGDSETALRLFKLAIENAPKPYSERLFSGVIATIPANVYWRGWKAEGVELAKLIESHISTDANKLFLLSTFYPDRVLLPLRMTQQQHQGQSSVDGPLQVSDASPRFSHPV